LKQKKEWLHSLKNNKLCVQSIIGFGLNQAVWKRRGSSEGLKPQVFVWQVIRGNISCVLKTTK
jgi:hypothetical protein